MIYGKKKITDLQKQRMPSVFNARVGRSFKICDPEKLCNPQSEFDMIESCKTCNKSI